MADRRIPFLDGLVLAVADGAKTVTRRLVNMRDYDYIGPRDCEDDPACWGRADEYGRYWYLQSPKDDHAHDMRRPYYPGDTLAVCEALVPALLGGSNGPDPEEPHEAISYRADGFTPWRGSAIWPWRVRVLPARYCPTGWVRYRRRILSVRPERLSWVTDDEARREGVARLGWEPTREAFIRGFRALHKLDADADPWIWRIAFERGG